MTYAFSLPDIGEGLHEAEIVRWLVVIGEVVRRDQPLIEVETDKALAELPSPVAGTIVRLCVEPGARVAVGTVLVEIDDGSMTAAPMIASNGSVRSPSALTASATERPRASPSTRRLAARTGVDLATITGSGPIGRITAEDVERAGRADASRRPPSPPPSVHASEPRPFVLGQAGPGVHPLRGVRRATAVAMDRSWREIPHLTLLDEMDATELLAARTAVESEAQAKVTLTSFLVAATARALRGFPMMNASIDLSAETFTVHDDVHVALATATDDGLIVPVLRHADRLDIVSLADAIATITATARARRTTIEELRGATFTVTNYGSLGGRHGTPIIASGQAGIIGFGAIRPRPFVVGAEVLARPTLPVAMSVDHRLIDGDLATAFVERVMDLLRAPVRLLVH